MRRENTEDFSDLGFEPLTDLELPTYYVRLWKLNILLSIERKPREVPMPISSL